MKKALLVLGFSGILFALPPHLSPKEEIKGINVEVFDRASFSQKREALKIDYEFKKQEHKSNEKYRQNDRKLDYDIRMLRIDLQEAKSIRDEAKVNTILTQIVKLEEKKRLNKEEERTQREKIQSQRISKIYQQLGIQ
ncbi:hypothetical protein B6S12_07340 [Helicobacter valdiviensis]|uniref:Uncharacterized protein n=1 Tax=Helicobacter valdiviensis TaxID=1458358 RepID=A0A2W6MUZ2_9HELI|nr:hypothetical protein [Helicobacter valdiviensis]PZT47739.1 hypothetical protein B6S12_07340 [Helicobacter valdiviensis]